MLPMHNVRTMFNQAAFDFLQELTLNNERAWFDENRQRYESLVREPALDFIEAMAPELAKISPHMRADARKSGGSLMRVFRDTRFARDKTPYKTNIGIQFRHAIGTDVHAPGFYVHLSVDECFFGAGCWHPEADVLGRIRDAIAKDTKRWIAARDDRAFGTHWAFAGESLTRPPRGYASDHPAIEDLKRKDFIALASLTRKQAIGRNLVTTAAARFATAAPLMRFLCRALDAPF